MIRKIPIAVGQICGVMSPRWRSGKPSSEVMLRMWDQAVPFGHQMKRNETKRRDAGQKTWR